ncbi:MAG: zinc ribbon domain-containing protein [Pyrinomonadaceae bacterium]|nr:zinc ribbon domain-containing protein [Pyrinomonadaceae bacterium]
MYCPSCGVSVAQGLSYCNYCGAKLSGEKVDSLVKTTELRAESLIISAMVGGFVLGLFAITVLMGVMKALLKLNDGLVIAFALLSFLILIVIEGVLIKRLFGYKRGAEEAGNAVLSKGQATKELDAAQTPALQEAMPSVTEHTTRTLEPVYDERTSK